MVHGKWASRVEAWATDCLQHPVTDKLPPYAITAETIACKQALMAIMMAVDMGQVVVNPKTCRVELMGKIAEVDKKFGIA